MHQLSGQRWVVIGSGKSGAAACELLLRRGATVACYDESPKASAVRHDGRFTLHVGQLPPQFWEGATAVVVSPGVPLGKPELQAARDCGAVVYGEVELAWRMRPPGAGPYLGITGTNGKSTTSALLGELVRRAFPSTFVGGNLGTALSASYLDPATPPFERHVVELSSFQLEGIVNAAFQGGAMLNLTPDHLDRYASFAAYGAAKAKLFSTQPADGFAVVNADDQSVMALAKTAHVPLYAFTFDAHRPTTGFAGVALADAKAHAFTLSFGSSPRFVITNKALRGQHNLANAMAATLMAKLSGVSDELVQAGLDAFPGLPHRLELVSSEGGVEWINDSKATNVDSAVVALTAMPGRVWLIAGGKGKGAPYGPMVDAARGKVLGVLTIGADGPAVADAFASHCEVHQCQILAEAVAQARALAKSGDIVLLSPACASYDQFDNFEHRGAQFKALVRGAA